MKATVAILAATWLAAAPLPVAAFILPPPPPPHHPERAGCAMDALVAAIDRQDRAFLSNDIKIYSNLLGEVTPDEFDQFFAEFAATGQNGSERLTMTHWGVLHMGETIPIYVMTMRRGVVDGHWSAWLVQFTSDRITLLRRADELWPFADDRHFFALRECPEAGANG